MLNNAFFCFCRMYGRYSEYYFEDKIRVSVVLYLDHFSNLNKLFFYIKQHFLKQYKNPYAIFYACMAYSFVMMLNNQMFIFFIVCQLGFVLKTTDNITSQMFKLFTYKQGIVFLQCEVSRIQFQALVIDYITILVSV